MNGIENKSQFAWNVHSYLSEYIKFGDTKAAFICGLSGPLVFGLLQLDRLEFGFNLEFVMCLIAVILFTAAFLCGLSAIWPNLFTFKTHRKKTIPTQLEGDGNQSVKKGFIYWKCILAHTNANSFANEVEKLDDKAKLKTGLSHVEFLDQ